MRLITYKTLFIYQKKTKSCIMSQGIARPITVQTTPRYVKIGFKWIVTVTVTVSVTMMTLTIPFFIYQKKKKNLCIVSQDIARPITMQTISRYVKIGYKWTMTVMTLIIPFFIYQKKKKMVHRGLFFSKQNYLYLETFQFVHLMVHILSFGSNGVHTVTSFEILNNVPVCTLLYL